MNVLVGSLKFTPIYKSHCCAFGNQCKKQGHNVAYIFSSEYKKMLSAELQEESIFIGTSTDIISTFQDTFNYKFRQRLKNAIIKTKPDYIYLHNYHPLNNYIATIIKRTGCKFIYHVHEPYTINKKAHGGIQQYWLYLFEYLQGRLLNNTDIAILSSKEACELFKRRYPTFKGKTKLIPLMYEDLYKGSEKTPKREYITFIGPPVPAKGPNIFLNIIDETNKQSLDYKYLLISRKKIEDSKYQKRNLQVFHKTLISDGEIGTFLKKSIMTITPYTRATQSSVVLVSYMYGTPVISSNVGGLNEFVHQKKTGYLVDAESNIDKWIDGIRYITKNNKKLSKECRKYFVNTFSESNWSEFIPKLLN